MKSGRERWKRQETLIVTCMAAFLHGTASAKEPADLTCALRAEATDVGLRIEAVGHATVALHGHYELTVAKESQTGSSRNVQSGRFDLEAGENRILANVLLDRSAIGHYRAVLALERNGTGVLCKSP